MRFTENHLSISCSENQIDLYQFWLYPWPRKYWVVIFPRWCFTINVSSSICMRLVCVVIDLQYKPWWRHQMKIFSALLAFCVGNSLVTGEFPTQTPVTWSLIFSLICAWINSWANHREAGDLRRYRAHYGITVMMYKKLYDGSTSLLHNCHLISKTNFVIGWRLLLPAVKWDTMKTHLRNLPSGPSMNINVYSIFFKETQKGSLD